MRWLGMVIALLVTMSCSSLGQPLNNTTENPDCTSHTDCSSGMACVNNKCSDPCLNACGINTDCHVVNLRPMCTCKLGYNGHPFIGCNPGPEPQCSTNAHCSKDKACLNHQCVDPCVGVCGVNTECKVVDHYPVCSCSRGFVWNPLSGCVPSTIPECQTNTQCPVDRACVNQKCVDPCLGVCGNNTVCHVTNHASACACKSGYSGNPFQECKPQCSASSSEIANGTRVYGISSLLLKKLSKKKFFLSTKTVSWQDAVADCRARDMELATIDSEEEQDEIESLLTSSGIDGKVWVSGTDLGETGNFIWASTGKSISYSNWWRGEPSGNSYHCIALEYISIMYGFKWMSSTCSYTHKLICEYYVL